MADLRGPLIGRGRTADVYGWRDGQIVKLFHDSMSDASIDEEARAGQIVAATGLPVPRFYDRVELEGRRGIVYERVEGPSMLAEIQRHPWRAVRYARQLADLHAAIHAVRLDALPPLRRRLRWQIEHAEPLPDSLKTAVLAALDRLPDGDRLCHGDFHPDNLLMTARGPVIIDWMTATCGDPLADVARTVLLFSIATPVDRSAIQRLLIAVLRRVMLAAYLRRYRALTGLTSAGSDAWTLPIRAARLSEHIPEETARVLDQVRRLAARDLRQNATIL